MLRAASGEVTPILRALNGQGLLCDRPKEFPALPVHRRDNGRAARDIWYEAGPAGGTLVEKYFRRRGMDLYRLSRILGHATTQMTTVRAPGNG